MQRPHLAAWPKLLIECFVLLIGRIKRGCGKIDRRELGDLVSRWSLNCPSVVRHEGHDRIPQLLSRHAAESGRGKAKRDAGGRIIDHRLALVGVGGDEDADKLPQVEVEPQHFIGQVLKQFGNSRGIADLEVIDGLHEAPPHDLLPEPVGDRTGKLAVVV